MFDVIISVMLVFIVQTDTLDVMIVITPNPNNVNFALVLIVVLYSKRPYYSNGRNCYTLFVIVGKVTTPFTGLAIRVCQIPEASLPLLIVMMLSFMYANQGTRRCLNMVILCSVVAIINIYKKCVLKNICMRSQSCNAFISEISKRIGVVRGKGPAVMVKAEEYKYENVLRCESIE